MPRNRVVNQSSKYTINEKIIKLQPPHDDVWRFLWEHIFIYLTACVFNTDIFGPARCYFSANIYKLICWRQLLKTFCQWPSPASIEVNWKTPTDLNRKQLRQSGLDSKLLKFTEMSQVEATAFGAKWASPGENTNVRNNRIISINK